MIEIVVVLLGESMRLLVENAIEGVHRENGDPGHLQPLDELLRHCRFAGGGAAANPDKIGLFEAATRAIIPRRATLRVDPLK